MFSRRKLKGIWRRKMIRQAIINDALEIYNLEISCFSHHYSVGLGK